MYSFRRPAHGAVMLSKTAKLKSVKKKKHRTGCIIIIIKSAFLKKF